MIAKRTVKRETAIQVRERGKCRNVIIIIAPDGSIGFRPKGLRRTEWLTADVCYSMAVKARVQYEKSQQRDNIKTKKIRT